MKFRNVKTLTALVLLLVSSLSFAGPVLDFDAGTGSFGANNNQNIGWQFDVLNAVTVTELTWADLEMDGMAFAHACGTVIRMDIQGEALRVDTGCLVAFTQGVDYSIERAGNLKSMFFGGEGMFLTTLSGQGTVWLQSLPFSRMADRIIASAPRAGGRSRGEGSVLGGLGNLLG